MRCKRSRVTPPDASVGTRPAICFTAAASSRSPRLSRRRRSAPAASASSICAGVLTSASMRRKGEAAALARRTAAPTPPAAAAWLSLTRIPSKSAPRWFVPPPARTAAFSSSRMPGLVFRVSSRRVRVPRSACAYPRVSVATPQRRCSRFNAVRSAPSRARRRPRTRRTPAPASLPAAALRPSLAGGAGRLLAPGPFPRTLRSGFAARLAARLGGPAGLGGSAGQLARLARRLGRLLGEPLLDLRRGLGHLFQLLLGGLHARLDRVRRLLHEPAGEALHPRERLRRRALSLPRDRAFLRRLGLGRGAGVAARLVLLRGPAAVAAGA